MIARELRLRRNDIHGDVPVVKCLVELLHLPWAVQQEALTLNAEGGKGIIVIDDGYIAVDGGLQGSGTAGDLLEEALDLVKFPALPVIRVQDSVAELLRALHRPPIAEIQQGLASMGHALPGPQRGLIGAGEIAGDVVALGSHDSLGNPEVLLFQPPDMVQAEGDLMGRERALLPAPDGVIVVGGDVQVLGRLEVVHVFSQPPAGEIVENHGLGIELPKQAGLEIQEIAEAFASKPLPVQPEGGVMGGNGGSGQGNLVKAVVLLGPEGGSIDVVEALNIPAELFGKEAPESLPAPGTPAEVAALMADFIVDLPGGNLCLALVMLRHGPDDLLGVFVKRGTVVTADMPASEGAGLSVLKLRKNVWVPFGKPGGDGGGRRAQNDLQTLLPGHGDHLVEEGKVVLSFRWFH